MTEHRKQPGRDFILALELLGYALGYHVEKEWKIGEEGSGGEIDVCWMKDSSQPYPIMIFEVESSATNSVANNAVKVFGEPAEILQKPLFFFHIVIDSPSDSSRLNNLYRTYSSHNYKVYQINKNDTQLLLHDILGQHRRTTNEIEVEAVLEALEANSWHSIDLLEFFVCLEKCKFDVSMVRLYGAYAYSDCRFANRYLELIKNHETCEREQEDLSYNTYIGQNYQTLIHCSLLAHSYPELREIMINRILKWQGSEGSFTTIGPHFFMSADYDEFICQMAPGLLGVCAAVGSCSSELRLFFAKQLIPILEAVLDSKKMAIYHAAWLLHVAAGLQDQNLFEVGRAAINNLGGAEKDLIFSPPLTIHFEDDDRLLVSDDSSSNYLVPARDDFIKVMASRSNARISKNVELKLTLDLLLSDYPDDRLVSEALCILANNSKSLAV